MGWSTVSPELREIMERCCTERELEVLKLKAAGYGWRAIALALGISKTSARDRFHSAERKIRSEVAAMRGVPEPR